MEPFPPVDAQSLHDLRCRGLHARYITAVLIPSYRLKPSQTLKLDLNSTLPGTQAIQAIPVRAAACSHMSGICHGLCTAACCAMLALTELTVS